MKQVDGLRLNIGYNESDLLRAIGEKLKILPKSVVKYEITKESIDARRKPNIYYNVNVAIEANSSSDLYNKLPDVVVNHDGIMPIICKDSSLRPIVVGFGPSGMFSALMFAKCGLKPIVIEQGDDVDTRQKKIDDFWQNRKLDVYSNVHFGEGGAGTFSDGKLNSNLSNNYCKIVTNELIMHGAPKEIFYRSKPHIGTDNLRHIVKRIREEIIALGGEVRFGSRLCDINVVDGKISSVDIEDLNSNKIYNIDCEVLVLAVGHSAKSVFQMLEVKGVGMEQKPFAMGVRIEQLQKDINIAQYGTDDKRLPSADYKLVEHLDNGRSVFTFCMCPGGQVVASSSEEKTIVTNGMSYYSRSGKNANSALLVNVEPKDFGSDNILAGFDLQSKYERLAFDLAGANYDAPAETVGSFLTGKKLEHIECTYRPKIKLCDIRKCLPDFVSKSIAEALPKFNKKIKNFAREDNLLIAIESRSSCPVRVCRDMENYMTNIVGLYAIGEGAGYAGGIMSSAQDGLKVAEKIIYNYYKK